VDAIDKNHDHLISTDELKSAVAALMTLDKNGDGQLQEDEYLPRRVDGGGPPRPRDGAGGPEGARPPREGDRPPREGDRGPEGRGPGDQGPESRGPGDRGPEGREQGGPPPPSPDRFVDHAMQFDTDKDGKLSRDELMKFAVQMPNHQPGGNPPGGNPQGDRRREGDRPETSERRGDRPARPDQE
jgi:EF hand